MTIALVVACKDNFYIISDTLMLDIATGKSTLNEHKVFFSQKHKFGMCIAGDADLKSNCSENTEYTSFIVQKFFEAIEKLSEEKFVEQTPQKRLDQYIRYYYPKYLNAFINGVEYFGGQCIKQGNSEEYITTIFSYSTQKKPNNILLIMGDPSSMQSELSEYLKERNIIICKYEEDFLVFFKMKHLDSYENFSVNEYETAGHFFPCLKKLELQRFNNKDILDEHNDQDYLICKEVYNVIDKIGGLKYQMFKQEKVYSSDESQLQYFTNSPVSVQCALDCFIKHSGLSIAQLKTEYTNQIIASIIPYACKLLNDDFGDQIIGNYLHRVKIFTNGILEQNFWKWEVNKEDQVKCEQTTSFPSYCSMSKAERAAITAEYEYAAMRVTIAAQYKALNLKL